MKKCFLAFSILILFSCENKDRIKIPKNNILNRGIPDYASEIQIKEAVKKIELNKYRKKKNIEKK